MTASWYPGAWIVDLGGTGPLNTTRPENVLHIAASSWNIPEDDPLTRGGITGWIETDYTEAHGYNDQFGNFLQYASVWQSVAGTYQGNWRTRTWEAWNPPASAGDLNLSEYTAEQVERFADLLAWDHIENGTLLQDMGNSRTSSHGVGCHRYGITKYNPWLSDGGEIWSTSSTKLCPGTARVRQLPRIISRSRVIAEAVKAGRCTHLPRGRVDLKTALARTGPAPQLPTGDWSDMATAEEIAAIVDARIKASHGTVAIKDVQTGWWYTVAPGHFRAVSGDALSHGRGTGAIYPSPQALNWIQLAELRSWAFGSKGDGDQAAKDGRASAIYRDGKQWA